jgi:hypothetical protein
LDFITDYNFTSAYDAYEHNFLGYSGLWNKDDVDGRWNIPPPPPKKKSLKISGVVASVILRSVV